MRKVPLAFAVTIWGLSLAAGAAPAHRIWSRSPAGLGIEGWERQSYPIGNGWFGANVFGSFAWYGDDAFGTGERVQLTENSMLTRRNLTNALEFDIQFRGNGHRWSGADVDFSRSLDLERGIADVVSKTPGCVCRREYFCSYPDRVLVMRFEKSGNETNALDVSIRPWIPFERPFGRGSEAAVGRVGTVRAHGNLVDIDQHLQYCGVKFHGRMLVETDGRLEALDHTIEVSGANDVSVFFSCGTNYRIAPESFSRADGEFANAAETILSGEAPAEEIDARVAAAARKGYARVKADHIADFEGLMNRVKIELPGADCADDVPTADLLKGCREKKWSARLEETYFQYGRYLLVSSSRPGTLPANLQGVWNAHERSPWGSGYWHNINVQMNYWPAFVGNLAECFRPYAEFNAAFRPVTRPFVADYLAAHGLGEMPSAAESPDIWCVGTAVYPYVVCGGPGGHSGPGTGGFTAKLFADWWDFTRDREALQKYIWPTVHGMADFLTRCVTETNGLCLAKFSASPEQVHKGRYYTTVGCAFDQQMLRENGRDLLRLAEILGTNDAVVARVRAQIDKYDPVQVGESGQVKEFREERKYGEIGEYTHRHISHLVGLYPGSLITKERPDWMSAARRTLNERSDKSTGWALAHRLNCWARLGDGDRCLKLLRDLLATRTYDNLWDAHPPFQIDGNFGATSGVCEMLLQSQSGYIDLLPALPKDWASAGSFAGLCARGGYEIDCAWREGRPVKVAVRGPKDDRPTVRFAGEDVKFEYFPRESLAGTTELTDWEFSRDGKTWRPVTVPHDWAIEGPFGLEHDKQVVRIVENGEEKATEKVGRTGALPWIGTGEYRRRVRVPAGAEWASLVFDGAMSEPEVFLDGQRIGGWKNGYTPFEVELPPAGGEVVVKLANPPRSSRWYPGAGLYRPVTLRWGKRVGVKTWGVDIVTPDLETVEATAELRNPDGVRAEVSFAVLDADGRCVAQGASPLTVKGAQAWSPECPSLYTLVTTVAVGGKTVDEVRRKFGFRTLEYGPGYFKLNGRKRKFRGVCLHHDLGPLGAAFSKDAFRRQVRLLKEMGCDSIRTAHNHPAPGQLEVCDEEGMMVIAESFDSWAEPKVENGYSRFFADWWKRDLRRLVEYGRGHPSVVMWSIGNEVWEQRHEKGAALYAEMQAFVHGCDHDRSRPVTAGASWMPDAIKCGFIAKMDVPAVTYRLPYYEAMHESASRQGSVLGIETASTVSSRGEYIFPVAVTDRPHHDNGQCSGYDVECCCWSNLPDDDWAKQDDIPWALGEFVWTGFDYLGEPTPYDDASPSRSSYFGIFDLAGLPKDRYWLYRSRWQTKDHTLHLVPHWTFPGREGEVTPVYCYTDFDEAELFLNGKSQGRIRKNPNSRLDRYRLRWNDVVYQPGELKVVAYDGNGRPAMTNVVHTAGLPVRAELAKRRFGNLLFVSATLVDAAGTLVPNADRTLGFTCGEGLRFKAICSGDATSLESFVEPRMRTFHGQLVAVFEGAGDEVSCTDGYEVQTRD